LGKAPPAPEGANGTRLKLVPEDTKPAGQQEKI